MQISSILALPLKAVPLVPLVPIELVAGRLFKLLLSAHGDMFERLGTYKSSRFSFVPTDLPLVFLIEPDLQRLKVVRKGDAFTADAGVEAPLVMLLALLEGRCDADALFFSRDLKVIGDMEAMLAMRNALDDCDIDLPRDLARIGGPAAPIVHRLAEKIRSQSLKETPSWN
ncbi:ubiquinone anaerobic biosynthesis accessory factor UbiT [Rhizobium sp. 'Codium 1']|uniref:ubiquinone anaerobic biosynthesis accessory factor UbiT n=1 Tax=Rhizobium sp. 'Codium 1' TaxID=2940484 RepID=UPI001E465750|nr:SCP2 sterol-binding domain-containing protein [Rhizobium sp. 'Codium 1']MCC8934837.1 SCP2 sterol-binding domain-containing protein [Rhizobium sp. 'Codium 1']